MQIENDLYLSRVSPVQPKTSFLTKISDLVRSIINYIKSFFQKNPFKPTPAERLSARDIKIMQGQIKPVPVPLPQPQQLAAQGKPDMEPIDLQLSVAQPQHRLEVAFNFEDAYLNQAAQETVRIASDSADLIYHRKIAPIIAAFQQGSKGIPELLKTIAGVVLKLGQAANKHYGAMIDKHEVSGLITHEFHNFLHWLCLNDFTTDRIERIQYKNQLYSKVRERLIRSLRPEMKDYLDPVLQWTLQSDHQLPFKENFKNFNSYNEEISKETLCATVQILIEFKVDLYSQYVDRVLQDNLPRIVHDYLRDNLAKMAAGEEIKHVLRVIKELPWTNLVDEVVVILHGHLTAFINGVKAQENFIKSQNEDRELQQRIALYKARIAAVPRDDDEIRIQAQAKSDLAAIEEEQERLKKTRFLSALIETKKTEIQYVIHPSVRAVAEAEIKHQDTANALAQTNHEFFSELADQIIDFLLPGDKVNIDFWLSKLTIPSEFKEIVEHTKKIAREVVSPAMLGILSLPQVWQDKIMDEAANIVVMEMKKWLKDILMHTLNEKLTQYADPDELNELMADQILPEVIIPQLIQTTAKHVLLIDLTSYSQDFTNLVNLERDQALSSIQTHLYQGTQNVLQHVNFAAIQLSPAKFNETIKSFLQELETRLQAVKQEDPVAFTREKVEILLTKYFADDQAVEESRPVYGKLVSDLISEMSTAGGWAKWGVKKGEAALSTILVTSMRDLRANPELTVKLLTESLSHVMAKDKLPQLYFGEKGPTRQQIRDSLLELASRISAAESNPHRNVDEEAQLERLRAERLNHRLVRTRNKLLVNMQVLSNITYDLAMAKINHFGRKMAQEYSFGLLGGFGASVSHYVGAGVIGTPEQLNEIILDLYRKLIGDTERNRSLINQVASLFMSTIAEKTRRLRHTV